MPLATIGKGFFKLLLFDAIRLNSKDSALYQINFCAYAEFMIFFTKERRRRKDQNFFTCGRAIVLRSCVIFCLLKIFVALIKSKTSAFSGTQDPVSIKRPNLWQLFWFHLSKINTQLVKQIPLKYSLRLSRQLLGNNTYLLFLFIYREMLEIITFVWCVSILRIV